MDLTTLKQHLRVTITDDDTLIGDYLTAARVFIEEAYDRALITQTWEHSLDVFPWLNQTIELPIWPLQSVTSVIYTDANNSPTTWPSTNYVVDAIKKPGRIVLGFGKSWPTPAAGLQTSNAVTIRYVAGYGLAAAVPWTTNLALMLLAGHWYETREPIMAQRGVNPQEIPFTVRSLLATAEIAGVS